MKRVWGVALALILCISAVSGCGSGKKTEAPGPSADGTSNLSEKETEKEEKDNPVEKPEKITMMVDGTVFTKENAQDKFVESWEKETGIKLEIIQPDHDAYYDVLGQTFASGAKNWPDVVILAPDYYSGYAQEGALWDMTDAWESSELKASGRINNEELMDQLYLNGKLYGFAPARGNGCLTYIKKKWLDNCDLSAPTNYEEYLNMLKAFTEGDPDGNGTKGDTYGVSAAGLIGEEPPYVNYLPEFYQDAYPSFYQKEDGKWVDGFTEDAMKPAITRLQEAYKAGYIDKETLTNGTKDCRNKFYEEKFGAFTYWAGTWATNMKSNLITNEHDGELIPLPPIKEAGKYLERRPPVWSITTSCENPEGVFQYFVETMLDGGPVQKLWSYGVEGTHWSSKAETICGNTYEDGQFHMLESLEIPGTQYTKNHIDPMLSNGEFIDGDPGKDQIAEEAREAQEIFNSNSRLAPMMYSTEEMSQYNGDLVKLKASIVADAVTQGVSVEEGYQRFEKEGGSEWSEKIVDSLNKVNQ